MDNKADKMKGIGTIKTLLLVAAMLIPIGAALMWTAKYFGDEREKEQEELRLDTLTKIVAYGNSESDAAGKEIDQNLSKEVDLTVSILQEYVTEKGYTGPRVLSHGFVLELKGEEVILPDGIPEGELRISRGLIEKSIKENIMRSGRLMFNNSGEEADAQDEPDDIGYYLSFGRITDDLIYAEITSDAEYMEYQRSYTSDGFSALQSAAEMFDGAAMLVTNNNGELKVIAQYGNIGDYSDLKEIGITSDSLKQESFELTINEQLYRCLCLKASGMWMGRENAYVIQMVPWHSYEMESLAQALLLSLLMALIFITMAVYQLSEQRYAKENIITGDDLQMHEPAKIRFRMINAGLVGALAIFVLSFLTQAVGQMYQQMRYGQDAVQLMSEKYTQDEQQKQQESIQKVKENWYVRYGSEIADFLGERPEMVTQEKLFDFCEILQADYIMIFNSRGNQVVCSRDYKGFTLDKGLGVNSADFRRLLMGVDQIVHQPSLDSITGLQRQMIGVKMAATDDPSKYGALIMALMPDQTSALTGMGEWKEETFLLKTEEVLCFVADSSSGKILYSGDTAMVGKNITDCGLSEKSLANGYMEFGTLNRTKRFIITEQSGDYTLYYSTEYKKLLKENLLFSGVATIFYMVAMLILGIYFLKGYTPEQFKEWSSKKLPFKNRADNILDRMFGWSSRTPEKKASLVFYVGMFIVLQLWLWVILGQKLQNNSYESLLDYLLSGNWMRGFNMFAYCSILMVISFADLAITISGWLVNLMAGFFSSKGRTICLLVRSIIKYAAIFAVIVISLEYLGVLNPAVAASLGIGSLALSFGAKDVVADFLAGIFIVFEETLRVGDIVDYDGKLCTVEEVGMRSTKLVYYAGNCLIISNHELTSVANLSKYNSVCLVYLKIMGTEPLPRIEEVLARELPKIKDEKNRLLGPMTYFGVDELGDGVLENQLIPTTTLRIGAECDQKNMDAVKLFINRELRLMCEREGIRLA